MKSRFILACFLFCLSFPLLAQEEAMHLKFMGIPLDGSLDSFVQKLTAKGLEYDRTNEGIAWLSGSFAGFSGCSIYIYSFNDGADIHKARVVFPEKTSWDQLLYVYESIKSNLSIKYGEPNLVVEEFVETPSYVNIDDNNDKMYEALHDRCNYSTHYITQGGEINLWIHSISASSCAVFLDYFDYENGYNQKRDAIEDL